MRACLPLAMFICCVVCVLPAQTLEVSPQRVLADESAVIRASGLQPNETMRTELTS
jgi:hypothetical protein